MDKSLDFAPMKSELLLLSRNFIGQADLVLANPPKHNRSLIIHPVK
jgi:hypothetical protein